MIDVVTGLTNCSLPDSVEVVDFLLQQDEVKAIDTDTNERNKLEQVKAMLSKTVYAYYSLCTGGKWHISNKSSGHFNVVCWNCERESSFKKKFSTKGLEKIAANKKKFSEQKQNRGGANGESKP